MSKVLIAFDSRTGHTEKMANYLAEGVRLAGGQAVVKKIAELKSEDDLQGFDAYAFGSPTYHRDMIGTMKTWLFMVQRAGLAGKPAGAFGSYTHSGDAPGLVADTMEYVFKMTMTSLGSLNMLEDQIDTPDGIKACQDYGKNLVQEAGG
ncbi:MAG: flavodoxin domain-containing protein [Proteobacteria bacterium]|nr:flavodoxin domain-containing protein [Pseudomonadota bacterium]